MHPLAPRLAGPSTSAADDIDTAASRSADDDPLDAQLRALCDRATDSVAHPQRLAALRLLCCRTIPPGANARTETAPFASAPRGHGLPQRLRAREYSDRAVDLLQSETVVHALIDELSPMNELVNPRSRVYANHALLRAWTDAICCLTQHHGLPPRWASRLLAPPESPDGRSWLLNLKTPKRIEMALDMFRGLTCKVQFSWHGKPSDTSAAAAGQALVLELLGPRNDGPCELLRCLEPLVASRPPFSRLHRNRACLVSRLTLYLRFCEIPADIRRRVLGASGADSASGH